MTTTITCRQVTAAEILSLRAAELRKEKPVESARFPEDEWETTLHYGAFIQEMLAGCVTLIHDPEAPIPTWQLRGMATDTERQQQGVGSILWQYAENDLRTRHPSFRVWCNARVNALPFYIKVGFTIISGGFVIESIGLHYKMEKLIM